MKSFTAVVALLSLLSGCTGLEPFPDNSFHKQPPPPDKARIVFFRQDEGYMGGRWAHPAIDGAVLGKLERREYVAVDAAPGEHEISVDGGEAKDRFTVRVKLEAGETYYLHVSRRQEDRTFEASGAFAVIGELLNPTGKDAKGRFQLEPVFWERAVKMLDGMKPSDETMKENK